MVTRRMQGLLCIAGIVVLIAGVATGEPAAVRQETISAHEWMGQDHDEVYQGYASTEGSEGCREPLSMKEPVKGKIMLGRDVDTVPEGLDAEIMRAMVQSRIDAEGYGSWDESKVDIGEQERHHSLIAYDEDGREVATLPILNFELLESMIHNFGFVIQTEDDFNEKPGSQKYKENLESFHKGFDAAHQDELRAENKARIASTLSV